MNEDIKVLLGEEIKTEIRNLSDLEGDEKAAAIENLNKLYKLRLEETRNELDFDEKQQRRLMETNIQNAERKEQAKDRYFRLGTAAVELVLPLIFYGIWMKKGFKFEETGTYTSTTFRGLFNRFRPTKK